MITQTEAPAGVRHHIARVAAPLGLGLVILYAALTHLVALAQLPPGMAGAEAAHGLLAREATGNGLAIFRDAGAASPLLAGLIVPAGQALGFDVGAVRTGAALAGIGAAVLTALWIGRAFGAVWGLAGGLLMAGSFWPLLFGRLGLSPVAGALALAALLWALQEALVRSSPSALPWYALAGLAAGIGFSADPPLRIMPALLLVALAGALWQRRRVGNGSSATVLHGLGLTLLVALLSATPYLRSATEDPTRLAFWSTTPGLPGDTAAAPFEAVLGYGESLLRLVWFGASDPGLNLPGDSLFAPGVAPWAVLGLALAVRRTRQPVAAVAVIWGALLLLPAALNDPGHPGRLLAATPLVTALPVLGMRAAVSWASTRRLQAPAVALVALTVIGSVAWANWRYFADWAPSDATARALDASVVDALHAARDLPPGQPVIVSVVDRQALLAYLGGSRERLQRVDGSQILALPVDGTGWLVIPSATPLDPTLLQVFDGLPPVETGRGPGGESYRIYQVDDRARRNVPLSVPTTPYADGLAFHGYRIVVRPDGTVAVVLTWHAPEGAGPHTARVRLEPEDRAVAPEQTEVPLPAVTLDQPTYLLSLSTLRLPDTEGTVALTVTLLDGQGNPVAGPGLDQSGSLLVDRFRFER